MFYRLFQRLPELVFELAGWPTPDIAGYRFRSEEIKQTAFRLDGLSPTGFVQFGVTVAATADRRTGAGGDASTGAGATGDA
ncbi:hypothetical protein BN874_1100024 [Candidatus Contendobacter odensis Run_B_J11]|uniref:Uncharacterized protein n=1 Tax=Candidatus Contendobacter odensis Run_B_J11 TaxID=1400861 RepID=A0A7U7G7S8_9GAMM|nr:hypothetical protein BN874_1100024 [Candidatus Contendobacter odensis Run_B_J11]